MRCGVPGLSLQGNANALPKPGATAEALVGNVPANGLAFLSIGLGNTTIGGTPLPLALDNYGMPGCAFYHDNALAFAAPCTATTAGHATFGMSIPNTQAFVGLDLFLQAWAQDASANAAGIAGSNALQVTVGL